MLLALLLPLLFVKPSNQQAEVPDLSMKAYEKLELYLDSGKVINEFTVAGKRPYKTAMFFRTAYSKKEGFNFEFYDLSRSNTLYTINQSNGIAQSWWGGNEKISTNSLSMLLNAAYGISSKTSRTIPVLLLSSQLATTSNTIYQDYKFEYEAVESVNGLPCYLLKRMSPKGELIKVWVAKDDFLIRKIESIRDILTQGDKMQVKTTTYYYVCKSQVVDKKLFTFRPNREVEL